MYLDLFNQPVGFKTGILLSLKMVCIYRNI